MPNTAANETGIRSIVDSIFEQLGSEKLSRILATPKLLDRLFTRWCTALGKSIVAAGKPDQKATLQKTFLEAINKKVEDHLFANCKSDKDLATKALNWAKVLNILSPGTFKRLEIAQQTSTTTESSGNVFILKIIHRYLNEHHLKSPTPSISRAVSFINQFPSSYTGDDKTKEMIQAVLFQHAGRVKVGDKKSSKKVETIISKVKDTSLNLLLKLQIELAHHSDSKKTTGKTDRSKAIARLINDLLQADGNKDLWQNCQSYEPRFCEDPSENKAALAKFRTSNNLPDFPIQDLILAVQTARGFKDGTLVVKDAQGNQKDITPTQAAAFHNFCNSSYFGHLGLIPSLTSDILYLSQVRAFKVKFYTEDQPKTELTENPIIVARDTQ